MRIVHVAPTPFGNSGLLGGGERYPLELARALARHVDCELVTFGRPSRIHREECGLRVRVLAPRWVLGGHPAHPVAPSLPGVLGRLDPDVVHTHQLKSAPGKLSALAASARGMRLVNTDHGLAGGDWFGLLPKLFDRFLAVSESSARALGLPPDRVRTIYGGTDTVRFCPDPEAARQGVLFVGRITPHKGVDHLIAALPADVRLTVAGSEGHDRDLPERHYPALLRRLAARKDVRFTGAVSEEELPGLYRSAAVFVLPSVDRTCYGKSVAISELLGLTVLEAMASGTPVVASRIGGLPEVVRDGETGFLVPPGDVDALRARIRQILSDRVLAQRMGQRAREVVMQGFTWESCAARCLAAYSEIV